VIVIEQDRITTRLLFLQLQRNPVHCQFSSYFGRL